MGFGRRLFHAFQFRFAETREGSPASLVMLGVAGPPDKNREARCCLERESGSTWACERNARTLRPDQDPEQRFGRPPGFPALASRRPSRRSRLRLSTAVNSPRFEVPGVSLGGVHLLVEGVWIGLAVFDSVEVLAVELGERCAV